MSSDSDSSSLREGSGAPESLPSLASEGSEKPRSPLQAGFQSLWRPLKDAAQTAGQSVGKSIGQSFQAGLQGMGQWFSPNEAELKKLLEQVRQSLPTTEVILIGKAQTGKSSIIRALTGVSAEIIGQGFRPHTAHTQLYAYPTADLPLLNFIDTVGLGEGLKEPATVTTELQALLSRSVPSEALEQSPEQNSPQSPEKPSSQNLAAVSSAQKTAQILVVTLKVTDFAVDAVYRLVRSLREAHPQIPCLLVLTCLHELYPAHEENHPQYPPTFAEVQRVVSTLEAQFDICDRMVLIDFTLEEDEFTPVFYGLDAFVEALSALLPAAEAQVIHQLLEQAGVSDRLGDIYRDAGRRYILPFSVMAATLAAVPLPFATMPVLTALQVTLVTLLGRLYGQTITPAQAGGIASAIAGGFGAQVIGRELVKFIPGLGSVIAASWAGAYTWALGEGACIYFGDLLGGKKTDPQNIQQAMKDAFKEAQERFRGSLVPPS